MDYTARNERMNRVLTELGAVVMWVQGKSNDCPSLHDQDGNCVLVLPAHLAGAIDVLDDSEAGALIEGLFDAISTARRDALHRGRAEGRRETIEFCHAILGVDRIVEALERSTAHI